MSTLELGIIGLGVGKGALLLNQKSDSPIKVCAVADKNPALLKLAYEDYGIGFVTEDYSELLSRSEVDVVGIFTPDHLHAEHAAAALEAGKHVICTKPMVTTMADCERLVHLVDRTGLKFVAAMTWHHLPKIVATRRAFDEGNLGKLTYSHTLKGWGFSPVPLRSRIVVSTTLARRTPSYGAYSSGQRPAHSPNGDTDEKDC